MPSHDLVFSYNTILVSVIFGMLLALGGGLGKHLVDCSTRYQTILEKITEVRTELLLAKHQFESGTQLKPVETTRIMEQLALIEHKFDDIVAKLHES